MVAYLGTQSIEEGQFPNEYAVSVTNPNGEITSGFFQKTFIREKDKKLEVRVLQRNDKLILLEVPGRFIQGCEQSGRGCYITVNEWDVSL